MRCPYCDSDDSKVTDSRNAQNGIRRRRECLECKRRFTTYERIHSAALMVTKRDGRREDFDREKLASGVRKACTKRPIAANTIEKLVEDIEGEFQGQGEVTASQIGEAVMEQLKTLDRVAYIRFASIYRDFQDIDSFEQAVKDLREGGGTQLTLPHIEPGPSRQRLRGPRAIRAPRQALQEVSTSAPEPQGDQEQGEPAAEAEFEANSEARDSAVDQDGQPSGDAQEQTQER